MLAYFEQESKDTRSIFVHGHWLENSIFPALEKGRVLRRIVVINLDLPLRRRAGERQQNQRTCGRVGNPGKASGRRLRAADTIGALL